MSNSTLRTDSDTLLDEENTKSKEEESCSKGKNRRQRESTWKERSSYKVETSRRGEECAPSQEAHRPITPFKSRPKPREDPTIQNIVEAMAEIKIQLANI